MAELERAAEAAVAALRRARPGARLRIDRTEYFDRADLAGDRKLVLAQVLDRLNRRLDAYRHFVSAIEPHVQAVARRHGRPARVLELACGSGALTLELAEQARARALPVAPTGSDIVAAYLDDAAARARARGLAAAFRRLDALDLGGLPAGAFDVAVIAQSLHHFAPGSVARLIAQARRLAPAAFVGIDGRRGLAPLLRAGPHVATLPLAHGARIAWMVWHDAVVSATRFFPDAELAAIARLAAPGDVVRTRAAPPYHTVLEVTPARPD